jgi:hypothetical protein
MYLAMEDGDIFFLEVDTQGPNLIQLANKACHLDCSIGTAFASLDFGLTKNDMLVAGGEMSSGGVYLVSSVINLFKAITLISTPLRLG